MARLDVYPMPGKGKGYIVDVQADLLSHLATRVVVPLLPEDSAPQPISELNPVFEILGKRHVFVAQAIASISRRELKRAVISLTAYHDRITRAMDIVLSDFGLAGLLEKMYKNARAHELRKRGLRMEHRETKCRTQRDHVAGPHLVT